MNTQDAVTELYGLPLEDFVAARNELVKRAKSEGAGEAAAQIKALAKPTVAAWLMNQLARRHLGEMDELVDLGERMREAAAAHDGRSLRDLTTERNTLINTLMKHARRLARDTGQRMSEDAAQMIGDTLHAAMADPWAADEVRAGCLARTLQHVGYGSVGGDGGSADVISLAEVRTARKHQAEQAKAAPPRRYAQRREEAEQQLAAAESAIAAAAGLIDELTVDLDERRQEFADAQAEVERLTAELDDANGLLGDARDEVRQAERDLDQAQAAAERARRGKREAERLLGRIGG